MPGAHHTAPDRPRCHVVGFDGSPEARAALEAAAHVAGPLGRVHVVVADDRGSRSAEALVRELQADAVPALRITRWEVERRPGPAADAILAAARERDATEIDIGSRGLGRSASILGSVAHDVLHGADLPVRIVTHRAAERLAHAPASPP